MDLQDQKRHSPPTNYHDEEWHTPKGRAIREVIFGFNDGLITTLGFLAGVTGSIADGSIILLAAMAEMVAGAIAMSSGAYISSKSQKEFFEKEIARERREIDEDPEHEKSEIREIYGNRGFTEEEISILTPYLKNPNPASEIIIKFIKLLDEEESQSCMGICTKERKI